MRGISSNAALVQADLRGACVSKSRGLPANVGQPANTDARRLPEAWHQNDELYVQVVPGDVAPAQSPGTLPEIRLHAGYLASARPVDGIYNNH